MRNSVRGISAITGMVLLVTLSGCVSSGGKNSMTLMLDVGYLPKHAPFISAVERGFFKEEGIDLTVMPGSGSTNTVTSVVTGKVDAGWADFGATVTAQGRGPRSSRSTSFRPGPPTRSSASRAPASRDGTTSGARPSPPRAVAR